MLTEGLILQGRYRVVRKLGEGGAGEVYLARHIELDAAVAVKTVRLDDPALREEFRIEGRLLAGLSHPNLTRVTDFFEEAEMGCLVMEYIDGLTLEQVVTGEGPLSEAVALGHVRQILDALEYLHTRTPPVIMRDLKPSNVMLDSSGCLRLIDFGIAKQIETGQQTRSAIRTSASSGYAPLEQYGAGGTNPRSDLYAMGATLLFLLTGQHPPDAVSRVTTGERLRDPRGVNEAVSEQTWAAIQTLAAVPQADRPASVAEARALLFGQVQVVAATSTAEAVAHGAPPLGQPASRFTSWGDGATAAWSPPPAATPTHLAPPFTRPLPPTAPDPRATMSAALFTGIVALVFLIGAGAIYGLKVQRDLATQRAQVESETRQREREKATADAVEAKARAARSAYESDANQTLDVLERFHARCKVGINYKEYNRELADVQFAVDRLAQKYDGTAFNGCSSLMLMRSGLLSFRNAGKAWRLQIDSDVEDYGLHDETESTIQDAWKTAGDTLSSARGAVERHD